MPVLTVCLQVPSHCNLHPFLLLFCLQPVPSITCTLLIPDSLLTCIVIFSFQKCLAAIPFTWGKKASWLTQTEQKLSFLLCIVFVSEKCEKFKKPGGIWGSLVWFCCWEDLHHPSFPFQCWVSDALNFLQFLLLPWVDQDRSNYELNLFCFSRSLAVERKRSLKICLFHSSTQAIFPGC